MKKTAVRPVSVLLCLFMFTACAGMKDMGQVNRQYDVEKVDRDVVEGIREFAFDIFKKLNEEDAGESIFISPLSISAALTMTYNGAETTTKEAMAKVLGFRGIERGQVNQSFENLLGYLNSVDKGVELNIANSIWIREGQDIGQEFLDVNRESFGARVDELDFSKESAADTINDWISKATGNKINKMIEPPIDPGVIMYLINGIYFKGRWSTPFDPENTFEGEFTSLDGTKQKVPMMSRYGSVEYFKGDDYKAVRLPYGSGSVSMTLILPDEAIDINTFIAGITREKLDTLQGGLEETEDVTLQIPAFKLEYGIKTLNDSLKALGMEEAFSHQADFSGIRGGLYISEVLHKSVIEVNEEGSEAAGATVVAIEESAPADPVSFIADRPFLFVISDDTTGTILFMGKLAGIA